MGKTVQTETEKEMKLIWIFNALATACIFVSLWIGISAAQPLPYSLSGHIMDNNSEYIVGADITLLNERTGDTLILASTTNGEYQQDAYNFASHYKNGDTIRYNVTYGNMGAVELADIDISKGGTKLDIILTTEDSLTVTPNSTPKSKAPHKTTVHMYDDTDGDGISDNEERARGWDKDDPCVPNSDSVVCKSKTTPQLTPEVFSPFKEEPTPIPTVKATPRAPKRTESSKRIPGFVGLEFLVIVLLILYGRRRR